MQCQALLLVQMCFLFVHCALASLGLVCVVHDQLTMCVHIGALATIQVSSSLTCLGGSTV
jgi:hypothetical protein